MNAKKVKAVRKFLRAKGVNPREDRYVADEHTRRTKSFDSGVLDSHAKPILSYYQTVSYKLAPGCGRSALKHLKAVVAERRAA